jgi:hypothetical protein
VPAQPTCAGFPAVRSGSNPGVASPNVRVPPRTSGVSAGRDRSAAWAVSDTGPVRPTRRWRGRDCGSSVLGLGSRSSRRERRAWDVSDSKMLAAVIDRAVSHAEVGRRAGVLHGAEEPALRGRGWRSAAEHYPRALSDGLGVHFAAGSRSPFGLMCAPITGRVAICCRAVRGQDVRRRKEARFEVSNVSAASAGAGAGC